jgi:hypothetical protein
VSAARGAVLTVLLLALSACATTTGVEPPATAVNVTGGWSGTWQSDDQRYSGQCRFDLKQQDNRVSGVLLMTGVLPVQPSGYIDGVVTNDQFSFTRGPVSGSFKVDGNTMHGLLVGMPGAMNVTLYRVGP